MSKVASESLEFLKKNLDQIVNSCKVSAKQWDSNTVPMNLLPIQVGMAKIKVSNLKIGYPEHQVAIAFNKTLDSFLLDCEAQAKEYGDGRKIAVSYIEETIDRVKSYLK